MGSAPTALIVFSRTGLGTRAIARPFLPWSSILGISFRVDARLSPREPMKQREGKCVRAPLEISTIEFFLTFFVAQKKATKARFPSR
jgi:hypothetical protein